MANSVYALTASFPKAQQFSLTQQIQRSAVSVASNIAEGANRRSSREYTQFLSIALGSVGELETQLMIAAEQKYVEKQQVDLLLNELDEIGKMLRALIKTITSSTRNQH